MFSFESASIEFKKPKNLSLFAGDQNYTADVTMPILNNMISDSTVLLTPTSPNYMPNSFHQNDLTETFNKNLVVPTYTYPSDLADFYSFAETPNSIQSATPSHTNTTKDDIFRFEPEHIELFQQSCYFNENATIELDAEYMNYDEVNCQSKDNSHCSSPNLDPWMCLNLQPSNSPKPNNNAAPQTLPSLNSFFGNPYNSGVILSDSQFGGQEAAHADHTDGNFNVDLDEKPNREEKELWLPVKSEPSPPLFVEDTKHDVVPTYTMEEICLQAPPQCLWKDCYLEFGSQATLVEHIEKRHVETRKGEEFSCHWLECARRQKPFNARYKLLIHMRVHSGEKPNKCLVSYLIDSIPFILFAPLFNKPQFYEPNPKPSHFFFSAHQNVKDRFLTESC